MHAKIPRLTTRPVDNDLTMVTETKTTATCSLNNPLTILPFNPTGLDERVTFTDIPQQHCEEGGGAIHDALKAEATVPQVSYPKRDVEYTKHISGGQSITIPSCQRN